MKTIRLILLILIFSSPESYCQDDGAEHPQNSYHLYFKADLLYPTMSLFSKPTALGASIELQSPSIVGLQLNGIYAFSSSLEVEQKDYQIIPEFRFYLNRDIKRVIFTGLYVKYNVYRYQSYSSLSATKKEMLYYRSQGLGFGGLVGYQWHIKRISFEARIGVGAFKDFKIDIYENLVAFQNDMSLKLDYMAGINIGWRIF
jgi:hypothetical protein